MSILSLRLAAPLQSWGTDSKFETRRTERIPTKSGIIGLLAAALGIKRNDDDGIRKLATNLRMEICVVKKGKLLKDYHIAKSTKDTYVTNRYYLSDAEFTVNLEGEDSLLEKLEKALQRPVFPLFLGRRSCPPEGKIVLGIGRGETLKKSSPLYMLRDEPISFNQTHRQFGFRYVSDHDAMSELKE